VKKGLLSLMYAISLNACAALGTQEPVGVTIADLKPIEVGVLEQRYALKVRLLNPAAVNLAFDGVVFDLEINDTPFAMGVRNQSGVLPRFGEVLIDLQAVSGLQNILLQINELLKGERTSLTYRIKGRLHGFGAGFTRFDSHSEIALPASRGKPGSCAEPQGGQCQSSGRLRRAYFSLDRTSVPAADSMPPMPLTRETLQLGTWRGPQSPRSWRAASMMGKMPYMPECV